jgi:hypothetical protein
LETPDFELELTERHTTISAGALGKSSQGLVKLMLEEVKMGGARVSSTVRPGQHGTGEIDKEENPSPPIGRREVR